MTHRRLSQLVSPFAPWLPLLLFVLITLLAAAGLLRPVDLRVEQAAVPLWSPVLAWTWAVLYIAGSALISAVIYLTVMAVLQKRDQRLALTLVIAFLAGNVIELALKHWLSQVSPPLVQGMVPVALPEDLLRRTILGRLGMLDAGGGDAVNSYPSGHVLRSLLVLVAVAAAWPRHAVRRIAVLACVAVTLILVAARVHWLSDVLGGALLAWTLATLALVDWTRPSRGFALSHSGKSGAK